MIKSAKMLVEEYEKTGGPAFPFEMASDFDGVRCKGMTLRDYFAAKAMQAVITDSMHHNDGGAVYYTEVAEISYEMADAMLKASSE